MVDTFEFESDSIGVYHSINYPNKGEVCVEINDGSPLALVYLTPEEARLLASELISEAEVAEKLAAVSKIHILSRDKDGFEAVIDP